jgi:hypothetical protein
MAKAIRSGGGITSNKLSQKQEATREKPRMHGASPGGADQLGQKMGLKRGFEPIYSGAGFPTKLGNELATNVQGGGPGKGRVTYRAGSQGTHGPVVQSTRPQGRDILGGFGPESSRPNDGKMRRSQEP